MVSCGSSHTLAVSKDGKTVWSFGSGESGKLGHGEIVKVYRPKIIEALQGLVIQKVCAGTSFSLVLTALGQVNIILKKDNFVTHMLLSWLHNNFMYSRFMLGVVVPLWV